MGHVLEAIEGIHHGRAVGLGLDFALSWSSRRQYLSLSEEEQIRRDLHWFFESLERVSPCPAGKWPRPFSRIRKKLRDRPSPLYF